MRNAYCSLLLVLGLVPTACGSAPSLETVDTVHPQPKAGGETPGDGSETPPPGQNPSNGGHPGGEAPASGPAVLATLGTSHAQLALGDDDVFFASVHAVERSERIDPSDYARVRVGRVAKAGGPVTEVATERWTSIDQIATTAAWLFLRNRQELVRMRHDGTARTVLSSAAVGFAASQTHAFYVDAAGALVDVSGESPAPFAEVPWRDGEERRVQMVVVDGRVVLVRLRADETGEWKLSVDAYDADTGRNVRIVELKRASPPLVRSSSHELVLAWGNRKVDRINLTTGAVEETFLGDKGDQGLARGDVGAFALAGDAIYVLARTTRYVAGPELAPYALLRTAGFGRPASLVATFAGERLGPTVEVDATNVYWIRRDETNGGRPRGLLERRAR
jgi:hypothetical protein